MAHHVRVIFGGSARVRRRRRLLLPALALVVSSAVVGAGMPSLTSASSAASSAANRVVIGAHDDTSTPFNLVSLPALFERRLDGHALRVVGRLQRTTDFTRWAISYRGAGLSLTGTLILPNRPGPMPLVVVAHGYAPPAIYRTGQGQSREERALAEAGYAVLHPDYRNHAGSQRESGAPVAAPVGYPLDVLNAIRALRRAHVPRIDWSRVGLLGRSMGGGVALQVAEARPQWFRALALASPVSSAAAENYDRWVATSPALRARVEAAYGDPATRPAAWREMSSRTYLHRIDVPVLINHGTADPITPYRWSMETAHALQAVGADVRLVPYPGESHRFTRQWPRLRDRLLEFYGQHLR